MEIAPKEAGFDASRLERITEHLERSYIGPGKITGCQTLVARHGHVAYFKSLGLADLERGTPVKDDTIFRLFSMTKPITSVALMQLYEQGYFQLNDRVSRVIPEWSDMGVYVSGEGENIQTRPPKQPMTFAHLLSHQSGLTYGDGLVAVGADAPTHPADAAYAAAGVTRGRDDTLEEFVQRLSNVPLRFDPGEKWMYSYSTDVCGYLVESLSGLRFDKYLEQNIFQPLGMKDTAFFVPAEKASRLAAAYFRRRDKTLRPIDDPQTSFYLEEPKMFAGGSGLVGTTADYLRFTEMLRRGGELDGERLLGSRTLEFMAGNHLPGDLASMGQAVFAETSFAGIGFGLGFSVSLDPVTAQLVGSKGEYAWGGAASTAFWIDPAEELIVIFLTQFLPSRIFNFRGQLKTIIYPALVS